MPCEKHSVDLAEVGRGGLGLAKPQRSMLNPNPKGKNC